MPAAALCWIVGLYSFSKVPFYLFAQTPSHGFEVCALLGCEPDRSIPLALAMMIASCADCTCKQPPCFWMRSHTDSPRLSEAQSSSVTRCSSLLPTT